jgi:hypothetical protein
MKNFNEIEKAFNNHVRAIEACETVQELINISIVKNSKGQKVPQYSQKFFNKKFKGNFKKCQNFVMKEAHQGFNNAEQSYLEESYF